jgi:hypothetical protein
MQQLREAFPWDQAPRYLLCDRDAIYGSEFAAITKGTYTSNHSSQFNSADAGDATRSHFGNSFPHGQALPHPSARRSAENR